MQVAHRLCLDMARDTPDTASKVRRRNSYENEQAASGEEQDTAAEGTVETEDYDAVINEDDGANQVPSYPPRVSSAQARRRAILPTRTEPPEFAGPPLSNPIPPLGFPIQRQHNRCQVKSKHNTVVEHVQWDTCTISRLLRLLARLGFLLKSPLDSEDDTMVDHDDEHA